MDRSNSPLHLKLGFLSVITLILLLAIIPPGYADDKAPKIKQVNDVWESDYTEDGNFTKIKLSDKTIALYDENGIIAIQEIKNNLDFSKKINGHPLITDCDLTTCTYTFEFTTSKKMKLKAKDFVGKWEYGEASVSEPYMIVNKTDYLTEPIFSESETCASLEINETNNETEACWMEKYISGWNYIPYVKEIQTPLDGYIAAEGEKVRISLDFHKSPTTSVAIYHQSFGVDDKSAGWWDIDWLKALSFNKTYDGPEGYYTGILNLTGSEWVQNFSQGNDFRITWLNETSSAEQSLGIFRFNDSNIQGLVNYSSTAGAGSILFKSYWYNGTNQFKLYMNNSAATDISNGDSAMLVWDDFEDGSLNTTKWTNGNLTEENGVLNRTTTEVGTAYIVAKNINTRNVVVITYVGGQSGCAYNIIGTTTLAEPDMSSYYLESHNSAGINSIYKNIGGSFTILNYTIQETNSSYTMLNTSTKDSYTQLSYNNNQTATIGYDTARQNGTIGLWSRCEDGGGNPDSGGTNAFLYVGAYSPPNGTITTTLGIIENVSSGSSSSWDINYSYSNGSDIQTQYHYLWINSTNATATFFINGTSKSVSKTNDSTWSNFSVSFNPTAISSDQTYSILWNISTSGNGTSDTNETYNLVITSAKLLECGGASNTTAANYSFYDESTGSPINASMSVVYQYTKLGSPFSSAIAFNESTNASVCIYPTDISFTATNIISLNASGYTSRAFYGTSETYDNSTAQYSLYLLGSTAGRNVVFVVSTAALAPQSNHTIRLYHYQTGSNSYTLSASGKTDSSGQSVQYLYTTPELYRVEVFNPSGVVVANITNPDATFCAGVATTSTCYYNIILNQLTTGYYASTDGVFDLGDLCNFDNSTKVLSCAYTENTTSSSFVLQNLTLVVFKSELNNVSWRAENYTLSSSTSIHIPYTSGFFLYRFYGWYEGYQEDAQLTSIKMLESGVIDMGSSTTSVNYGRDAYMMIGLLIFVIAFALSSQPSLAIIGVLAVIDLSTLVGLLPIGGEIAIVITIIGLIVANYFK